MYDTFYQGFNIFTHYILSVVCVCVDTSAACVCVCACVCMFIRESECVHLCVPACEYVCV